MEGENYGHSCDCFIKGGAGFSHWSSAAILELPNVEVLSVEKREKTHPSEETSEAIFKKV